MPDTPQTRAQLQTLFADNTTGQISPQDARDLIVSVLMYTGAWSGTTLYQVYDVVSISGTFYVCILANTDQQPPNSTYWAAMGGSVSGYLLAANNFSDLSNRQTALNTLAGGATAGEFLRGNGTNVTLSAIQVNDIPALGYDPIGAASAALVSAENYALSAAETAQNNAEAASCLRANNLSDLASASTARANLGLGSAATQASSAFDAAGAASAAQTAAVAAVDAQLQAANTLWLDLTNGNDTTAAAAVTADGGSRALPFATLANAITAYNNAVSNFGWTFGVLRIGPGTFAQGAAQTIFPAYLTVIGSGKYATVLSSTYSANAAFTAKNNVTIDSLTLSAQVGDTTYRSPFGWTGGLGSGVIPTGVVLRNCYVVGDSDALYIQKNYSGATFACYDCSFASSYDSYEANPSGSGNWTCDFWNCDFTSTGPDLEGASAARGVALAGTLSRFYGCRIIATNGNGVTYGVATLGGGATVELHGCKISTSTSSGTIYDISNAGGGSISIDGATQFATSTGTITPLSGGVTGGAPSTNSQSSMTTVYGASGTILGTPRAWKTEVVGGTSYSVPLF